MKNCSDPETPKIVPFNYRSITCLQIMLKIPDKIGVARELDVGFLCFMAYQSS